MSNEGFDWDKAKAAANLAKHGVSFERASLVFKDAFGLGFLDDRDPEERWIRLGMVEGTILFVVYTERFDRKRIISAREATRMEQDTYFKQNASE
jgi:uncharacterized protein